ncbi:hypothetical protein HG530_006385 [Fusarium avenaceum]|nr:hypothetical protein HG530_006385 [Fusarium avenaceum]
MRRIFGSTPKRPSTTAGVTSPTTSPLGRGSPEQRYRNFTVDHMAGILQIWGVQRGMLLQLEYLLDGPDAAGQILLPSDNHTTICTHNYNAIQSSGSSFNHYSGVELPPPSPRSNLAAYLR